MKLHEAILEVLGEADHSMTTEELASEINRRGLYLKRNRTAVTAFQIHGRTKNYPELFVREGTSVALREGRSTIPPPAIAQSAATTKPPATAADLGELRRELMRLLGDVDPEGAVPKGETIGGRVGRLSWAGVVPRNVAACMKTVLESRNKAEYETETLSPAEAAAAKAAWAVVKEWADNRGRQ